MHTLSEAMIDIIGGENKLPDMDTHADMLTQHRLCSPTVCWRNMIIQSTVLVIKKFSFVILLKGVENIGSLAHEID